MKKVLNYILAICLFLPSIFALTACGKTSTPEQEALKSVAGIYTNAIIDNEKTEYTFDLKEDGSFTYTTKEFDGIEISIYTMSGTLKVDKDKHVTDVKFNDIITGFVPVESILGTILPQEELGLSEKYEAMLIEELYNILFASGINFQQDYMILDLIGNVTIMYKADATRLNEGTVLSFITEKEYYDANSVYSDIMGTSTPKYETDYYFEKDCYDLTKDEDKADFIEELEDASTIIISDYWGNLNSDTPTIKSISDFDITTAGVKTGTITYESNGVEVQKQVSYTVVENKENLPINQVKELKLRDKNNSTLDDILFVAKDAEFYSLNLKLRATTYDYDTNTILLNEENCTGDSKVIDIVGYDKTKTGYQLVTVKYRNAECKQSIFVYSEEVNPVINAYSPSASKVVITKTSTGYDIDYSNAKIQVKTADGASTEESLTSNQVINQKQLKDYEDDDYMTFSYNYTYNNTTYTFYVNVRVQVVDNTVTE